MPLGGEKKAEGASVKRREAQDLEKSKDRSCVCQKGSIGLRIKSRFYFETLRFYGRNFVRKTDGSGILVNPSVC